MTKEDPTAPTEKEAAEEAVSKYRYMDWRDCISSSRSLGFRIEGVTIQGISSRDYKTTREIHQIKQIFDNYVPDKKIRHMYLERVRLIKTLCEQSDFFSSHELIGSSLLFVHDEESAGVWMIDFEKTRRVEGELLITHQKDWDLINHEDGYLTGLDSVLEILSS